MDAHAGRKTHSPAVHANPEFSQTRMFDEEAKDSRSASLHAACSSSSGSGSGFGESYSLSNPSIHAGDDIPQPTIFNGKLKGYQLKGMNWLANLYEQARLGPSARSSLALIFGQHFVLLPPPRRELMESWQMRWGWERRSRASRCWHTLQR